MAESPVLPVLSSLAGLASGRGRHGRLFILIYHQVLDRPDPMRPDEPDVERFSRQMDLMARYFHVLPLKEGIRRLQEGRLPPRAVAITFDDGYRNNFTNALPILEARDLHATFFVATGFLDGGRMWNDTVIEALRTARVERLEVPELGLESMPMDTSADRCRAAQRVITAIKHLPFAERARWVERIASLADDLPGDMMMTSDQVRELHARGMEIGGHTVNHPILAKLDEREAMREIREGKRVLEELLGERIVLFAYPNGRKDRDYTRRDVRLVEECGFEAAVSTNPGASGSATGLYELNRFTPWDRSPQKFMLRIARYYRSG